MGGAGLIGLEAARAVAAEPTVGELDQKIKILERKLEIADEAALAKAKDPVSVKAGREGFSLNSADKAFQLKLRGLVQFDGRFFLEDEDKKASDTFVLRRIRPTLEGKVFNDFGFRITPDFGGGQTVLFDAYGEYTPIPEFGVRVGKFKPPVGLERLQSANDIAFTERGLPTLLVPSRDLGVQVSGDFGSGTVHYAAGIFNGTVNGGNGDADTNDCKDLEGRLFLHPFRPAEIDALANLGIGVAATTGDHEGSPAAPGLPSYRSIGQQTAFSYRSSTNVNGTSYADGQNVRIAPQAYWYVGPVGFLGEYVQSRQDVSNGKNAAEVETTAWQLAGSWVLTGENASYKGVTPLVNYDPSAGHFGAFEVVGRIQNLSVDDGVFNAKLADPKKSVSEVAGWGVGLNWYLNRNVKVSLDYENYAFEDGAATGDRPDEKIVFSRVQFAF